RKYRVWAASALQLNGKWVTTSEEILSVRPDERGMMLITIAKKGIELMEGRTDGDQNSGFRPSVFGSTESAPTPPLPR
ncbi:MAG: hypothetical protein H7Y06_08200, partial [Opitutaceae bacterium]|nr:hypothetical protein [Opitutaceae bacterium]